MKFACVHAQWTMGRPRVKIKVSKLSSQSNAFDEIIKGAPPATLVVIIGTKVNISTMGRPSQYLGV